MKSNTWVFDISRWLWDAFGKIQTHILRPILFLRSFSLCNANMVTPAALQESAHQMLNTSLSERECDVLVFIFSPFSRVESFSLAAPTWRLLKAPPFQEHSQNTENCLRVHLFIDSLWSCCLLSSDLHMHEPKSYKYEENSPIHNTASQFWERARS